MLHTQRRQIEILTTLKSNLGRNLENLSQEEKAEVDRYLQDTENEISQLASDLNGVNITELNETEQSVLKNIYGELGEFDNSDDMGFKLQVARNIRNKARTLENKKRVEILQKLKGELKDFALTNNHAGDLCNEISQEIFSISVGEINRLASRTVIGPPDAQEVIQLAQQLGELRRFSGNPGISEKLEIAFKILEIAKRIRERLTPPRAG